MARLPQDRRHRQHGERQERDEEPRAGRPAAGPLRVAEVHEEDRDDHQHRDRAGLEPASPEAGATSPARREQQDRGIEEEPAITAPEERADEAPVGRLQPERDSRGCGPWRRSPWHDGNSPCPRASRRRAGCSRAGPASGPPRRPRTRPARRASACRPGTGPPGRGRGSPRPARPGARSPRRRPRGSRPRRGARSLGARPRFQEQRERGEQGERRGLVAVGQGRVDVGGGRQAVGQAHQRRPSRRAAEVAGQSHQEHRRQGGEEPGGPQRDPVIGRPVGHGLRRPSGWGGRPSASLARA